MSLSAKGLSKKIGSSLFSFNFQTNSLEDLSLNQNKLLMQRYSLISQLDNYKVFGIIVSNTATKFHKKMLSYSETVLKKNDKKTFTFMMSRFDLIQTILMRSNLVISQKLKCMSSYPASIIVFSESRIFIR